MLQIMECFALEISFKHYLKSIAETYNIPNFQRRTKGKKNDRGNRR